MMPDKSKIWLMAVGFLYGAFSTYYFWIPIEVARSIGPTFNNILFALTAPAVIVLMVAGNIIANAIPHGIQFFVFMALNGVIWAILLLVCKTIVQKVLSMRRTK